MRRSSKGVSQTANRKDVTILECRTSACVPGAAWKWMEQQICDGDGVTQRKARDILQPEDKNMRYALAISRRGERHDVMGRSRRATILMDYSEQRTYTKQSRDGDELGEDKGRVQSTSKWGWRMYEAMSKW